MHVFRSLSRVWPITYVTGAVLLLSILLPMPQHGRILNIGSICTFHNFFGIPCPGCGLTRSFVAMGHGQLTESFRWHVLGPFLFGLTIACFFGSLYLNQKRPSIIITPRFTSAALLSLTLLLGIFWGLRLNGIFPLPSQ